MRAVLTSFGSTGDIQPLMALAVEMRRQGHHPVLALSPNYAGRAAEFCLEFVPVGPELKASDIRQVITAQMSAPDAAVQVHHFLDVVMPMMPLIYHQLLPVCEGADILISTPHQIAAHMVHEALGIPYVTIHLSHFGALGSQDIRDISAPIINRYRQAENLPPLDDPLTRDAVSPQLALYAVSTHLLRRPNSWPAHHHVTGYFFLEEDHWQPDQALLDFLQAGPPPVVVTFSSVVHEDPALVTETLLRAIEMSGCRAILMRGWSGLGDQQLPPNVLAVGFVSHAWLFEKASCIVHHGGAGTTAAAFRAGKPTVIIPHTLDQPIWAEFARALGTTSAVIPYNQLTAETVASAISAAATNPKYLQAAEKFGRKVAAEHGAQTAVQLIETRFPHFEEAKSSQKG